MLPTTDRRRTGQPTKYPEHKTSPLHKASTASSGPTERKCGMTATPNTTPDLSQPQMLAHIAHLSQVGHPPPPTQVRFAADRPRRQVHITCEDTTEGLKWADWIDAEDSSGEMTTIVHWIADGWHGWDVSIWSPTEPHRPEMTPRNLAAALLES